MGCSNLMLFEVDRIRTLHARLQKISNNPTDYQDPTRVFDLPFPSIHTVPSRFAAPNNLTFAFIGREHFAKLWNAWLKIKSYIRYRQAIYVYGTMGYGKSHLLAALACLLVRQGERVVYLPDCRKMLSSPIPYLQKAFLFAFQDNDGYVNSVLECQTYNDLLSLTRRFATGKLCFIVDQINALDPEDDGKDNVQNPNKAALYDFLLEVVDPHIYITSASANHKSARHMAKKQTDDEKLPFMGGMTKVSVVFCFNNCLLRPPDAESSELEMEHWWLRHVGDFEAFSPADKKRVEDLTGCIPLLLRPFLGHAGKTLASLETHIWDDTTLADVGKNTLSHAYHQKRDSRT
jgi:hypothetical protein